MKIKRVFLAILASFFVFFLATNNVLASAKTDYDYQWSKYRENYAEYKLLKQDYLKNPTLDNQQKAILSAKQTILARDLAKSSYAKYMADLINTHNTGYKDLDPILARLDQASTFFSDQAELSQKIVTPADLKLFASEYSKAVYIHDQALAYGQVGSKIANLVRFQIDAKDGLDIMTPKLPVNKPAALQARLDDIPIFASNINAKIAETTALIIPKNERESFSLGPRGYIKPFVSKLEAIRKLQLSLIDQLKDIDISYVQSKI